MKKYITAGIAYCTSSISGVQIYAQIGHKPMPEGIMLNPYLAFRCAKMNVLVENCLDYFKNLDSRCYEVNIFSEANCGLYLSNLEKK